MTLDQLLADLDAAGVCTLDTGGQISAAEARRLACSAGIIPMVLGGKSQVLEMGRKRRFHTEPMRIAMGVRDGGCTTEHCDVPPGPVPRPPRHPLLRGRRAPASRPAACSAPATTAASTTPATRSSTSPTARSGSTDGSEARPPALADHWAGLDAGFRVVGRLHVTLKRLPPPPDGGGGASPSSASPSPPWRGEALLHSSVALLQEPPVSTEIECGWRFGVRRSRGPRGSQSLSWSWCRSHPSMATGRGRARAGRVNQASCGAVRHDCPALCHPQQRIDQRSTWRRRQSRQGPPGRAPSNPIH